MKKWQVVFYFLDWLIFFFSVIGIVAGITFVYIYHNNPQEWKINPFSGFLIVSWTLSGLLMRFAVTFARIVPKSILGQQEIYIFAWIRILMGIIIICWSMFADQGILVTGWTNVYYAIFMAMCTWWALDDIRHISVSLYKSYRFFFPRLNGENQLNAA